MRAVPLDRVAQPGRELAARLPTELALDFAGVDRVAAVVPETVGHVTNEATRLAEYVEDEDRNVDVLPLVAAAEIVDLADRAFAQHEVDASTVILDVDPIAHLPTVAVKRERLVGERVGDEERDQLLGKLVGPVVVRAARDEGGEAVRMVGRAHEEISGRLARRVGAVRRERGLLAERAGRTETAVDLVGRDLHESADAARPRRIEQHLSADDVGREKRTRVGDRTIDVRLGGEVDDGVDAVADRRRDRLRIGDVAAHETMARIVEQRFEVREVAGVREQIERGDCVVRVGRQHVLHEVRADEAGAAGHEELHRQRGRVAQSKPIVGSSNGMRSSSGSFGS